MLSNLRLALRVLKQNPGFGSAAIVIVALGVGVTTAIFSIVYSVALQPLPYAESDRLVRLRTRAEKLNFEGPAVSAADLRDVRSQNSVFEDVAMVRTNTNLSLTGEGEPERLNAVRVTPNLFSVLRTQPAIGRGFRADEDEQGKQFVAVLGDSLWKRRFAGDANILGKTIRLNSQPYTVVGIMSADFRFPGREYELWVPLLIASDEYQARLGYDYQGVARLKPGYSLSQAAAELETISRRLARDYRQNAGVTIGVAPMLDEMVGSIRTSLYVLFGAVGVLLLIGCANLANLLLARTISRSKEFVIRAALGARTGRLAAQSIGEVVPIVLAGGVIGLLVAQGLTALMLPLLPASMPRVEEIKMSGPVFIFAGCHPCSHCRHRWRTADASNPASRYCRVAA
jgi:predicted permease